jgi:signal transduction histidine kinase
MPLRKLHLKMRQVSKGDFTAVMEDKSRIKEIDNIYKNFNLMVKELGALETIQSDFVSNVSHEFKTPLSAIQGYSMLLQGSKDISKEQEEYIEKILFNTERLSDLVGNILLLAKLDNQKIQTKATTFRVDEQIRQAILLQEIAWTKKNIYLDVELDSAEFFGTKELLFHVWNNIISNAIKFSPNNGKVMICLTKTQESLIFTVTDNGIGLSEEVLGHMYDKFFQGDGVHKSDGNGLGLSLAKRIVDMCGGKIFAENLEIGGCEFTVTLPYNTSKT